MDEQNKNPEELNTELEDNERAKISLPEIIVLIILAGSADALELFSLFAIKTIVIPIMAWFYGIFISATIFLWLMFRGASGGITIKQIVKRRLVPLIIGFTADMITGGFAPIRTITLAIVIFLNNKFSEQHREKILKLLGKWQ